MSASSAVLPKTKVIVDTDLGWLNDSCINMMYALCSPSLQVLGVSVLAGNFWLAYSVACALRMLELMGRTDVPVCPGFDRPLLHERDDYADNIWGKWAVSRPGFTMPEGFPTTQPDPRHAIDFIGQTILEHPGEITLITTGPMTNLAVTVRRYPEIVKAVRQVVSFGGAFPILPRGWGNATPAAEFNIWVDPEAAQIVLRSGLPQVLIPLNLGRLAKFTRAYCDRITAQDTVIARLFRNYMIPRFEDPSIDTGEDARLTYAFFAQLVTSYVLRPDLFEVKQLCVDVDTNPGIPYGATYGYKRGEDDEGFSHWPLETGARSIIVASDVDFEATAEMVIAAFTRA